MGKLKTKKQWSKVILSFGLSLLMVMGMISTNTVSVSALTMTEVLRGKKVTFYVNQSINVFDALKAADSRLQHLDNGSCFTGLTLNYSTNGGSYYNINGQSVIGKKAGITTILISGVASCGAESIYETFNNTPIEIEIKKIDGTKPSGYVVKDANQNGGSGSITQLDPTIIYEYKNVNAVGSSYIQIPSGSTSINLPKGNYYLRVAETATANASKSENIIIKEPAPTPNNPTVTNKTDTTITISTKTGEVYSIDNGRTWINGPSFQNLRADTTYTILSKKVGVASEYTTDSEVISMNVKTKVSTDSVVQAISPNILSYNDTSIKVRAKADEEYSIDGGRTWRQTGEFYNLTPNQSYNVVARKTETENAMPGPISQATTIKTKISSKDVLPPANTPILEATDTSIKVMNPDSKNEYSIDGGITWVKPTNNQVIFTGLEEGTKYRILTRTAETDTAMPSTATKPADITTLCHLTGHMNANKYPVSIKILDSQTGKIIKEIETDNQGNYDTLLPKGDYKIIADSNGESIISNIQLEPNDSDKNLTLQAGALISGTVQDSNGHPVANAKVVIETPEGKIELTTDQQGNYYTDAIKDGSYQSYIYTSQGEPQSTATTIEVKQGQMTTAPHTDLKPGFITKGDVVADVNGDGNLDPIKNSKVELIDNNGNIVITTTTDKNGSYTLPSVAKGTYTLKITDSATNAIIERTIQIGNDNSTALGTTPQKVDATTEINAEKFIQNHLVDSHKNVITKPTGDNYKTILDSQEKWNQLSQDEKDETNKILVNKYNGMTYPDLLQQAVMIQKQAQNFINENMTSNNQIVTEVNSDTYAKVIAAKDAWDKLTADEKQAANDSLKASGATQTYDELYSQATAIKDAGNQFIKDHMTLNSQIVTKVNSDTYAKVIAAKDAWDKLTADEKQAANDVLKASGATQTYDELYTQATAIKDAGNQFIKDHMTLNSQIVTKVNEDTYDIIITAKDAWDKLTADEKQAANDVLKASGATQTYEEMYASVQAKITQNSADFINQYLSDQNKNIYKDANKSNYAQILSGKETWNKLSQSEKDLINAILITNGSKTYEELLKQAQIVKESVQTNDNTEIMSLCTLLSASLILGGYIFIKRRKRV